MAFWPTDEVHTHRINICDASGILGDFNRNAEDCGGRGRPTTTAFMLDGNVPVEEGQLLIFQVDPYIYGLDDKTGQPRHITPDFFISAVVDKVTHRECTVDDKNFTDEEARDMGYCGLNAFLTDYHFGGTNYYWGDPRTWSVRLRKETVTLVQFREAQAVPLPDSALEHDRAPVIPLNAPVARPAKPALTIAS